MIDPIVAFDKLAQFETSKDIADFFRTEGIKGYRKDANMCPIASFMELQTGTMFGVTEAIIETCDGRLVFENSPAMQDFVSNFDDGGYDFLDADPESDWVL